MSWDGESSNHSARVIVEAAEILQNLTPSRIATMLFVSDDDITTQTEMAEILDVSTSTITTYLQSLENLPLSLTKREHQYKITPAGDSVIELLDSMLGHLGVDLSAVDWRDEDNIKQIGELLSPLHNSRSIVPFFVLYSIGQRSAVGGQLDRFVSPQSVQLEEAVDDVKKWQEQRGQSSTRKQIRWVLNRFEECGTIKVDDETIKLMEKGQEHVRLLEQLTDLLEEDNNPESTEDTSRTPSPSTQPEISTETATGKVDLQLGLQNFSSKQGYEGGSELPIIVPAYCVSSSTDENEEPRSPSTVLPLTPTTTVEDLVDQIHRIGREHGNVQLELFWTELRSETPDTDSSERSQLQR